MLNGISCHYISFSNGFIFIFHLALGYAEGFSFFEKIFKTY